MKLSRRAAAEPEPEAEAELVVEEMSVRSKGRPTPKRRDAQARRGPVTAPKTRKEAYARQKRLAKEDRANARAGKATTSSKPRSVAEQRAALRRGDTDALPRRDQGPTRKLARDYVDSHRMVSNYLLILFPFMIASYAIPAMTIVVIVVFLALLVEWYITGRRICALAVDRFGSAQGGAMTIGFYAGSRAYLPRRWRLPGPQKQLGDEF